MAACTMCGGYGTVTVRTKTGCGIATQDCPCVRQGTPGRMPHPHQIHYPDSVIQSLKAASAAQQSAMAISRAAGQLDK